MKNLTIEELNNIVSSMNLEQIRAGLAKHGYRHASKHDVFEFDLMKIISEERTTATDDFEDVFDDHSYFAEVFENVKGYEGYTFIIVTQLAIYRDEDNREMPEQIDMYTDAPVNEVYERELESERKCPICKKIFKSYDMYKLNGEHYCKKCYGKAAKQALKNADK